MVFCVHFNPLPPPGILDNVSKGHHHPLCTGQGKGRKGGFVSMPLIRSSAGEPEYHGGWRMLVTLLIAVAEHPTRSNFRKAEFILAHGLGRHSPSGWSRHGSRTTRQRVPSQPQSGSRGTRKWGKEWAECEDGYQSSRSTPSDSFPSARPRLLNVPLSFKTAGDHVLRHTGLWGQYTLKPHWRPFMSQAH